MNSFNPGFILNSTEAPVWLIFDGTVAPSVPASFDLVVESSANTPGLERRIEAWNFTTSSYDLVATDDASFNTDVVKTINFASASDYQSGSGEVSSRIGWRKTGFTILFPWTVSVDQVVWSFN